MFHLFVDVFRRMCVCICTQRRSEWTNVVAIWNRLLHVVRSVGIPCGIFYFIECLSVFMSLQFIDSAYAINAVLVEPSYETSNVKYMFWNTCSFHSNFSSNFAIKCIRLFQDIASLELRMK